MCSQSQGSMRCGTRCGTRHGAHGGQGRARRRTHGRFAWGANVRLLGVCLASALACDPRGERKNTIDHIQKSLDPAIFGLSIVRTQSLLSITHTHTFANFCKSVNGTVDSQTPSGKRANPLPSKLGTLIQPRNFSSVSSSILRRYTFVFLS